jgi:hypothetical protein
MPLTEAAHNQAVIGGTRVESWQQEPTTALEASLEIPRAPRDGCRVRQELGVSRRRCLQPLLGRRFVSERRYGKQRDPDGRSKRDVGHDE